MDTHTSFPSEKLSPWYFSVRWAIYHVESSIARCVEHGLSTTYDEQQLVKLQDLEQFLKMSWDVWMDELATTCCHAVQEMPNER